MVIEGRSLVNIHLSMSPAEREAMLSEIQSAAGGPYSLLSQLESVLKATRQKSLDLPIRANSEDFQPQQEQQ